MNRPNYSPLSSLSTDQLRSMGEERFGIRKNDIKEAPRATCRRVFQPCAEETGLVALAASSDASTFAVAYSGGIIFWASALSTEQRLFTFTADILENGGDEVSVAHPVPTVLTFGRNVPPREGEAEECMHWCGPNMLFVGFSDGTVRVWDTASLSEKCFIQIGVSGGAPITSLATLPHLGWIVCGDRMGFVNAFWGNNKEQSEGPCWSWSLENSEITGVFEIASLTPYGANSQYLAVTLKNRPEVHTLISDCGTEVAAGEAVGSLGFVVAVTVASEILMINPSSGDRVNSFKRSEGEVRRPVVSPDLQYVAALSEGSTDVEIWERSSGSVIATLSHSGVVIGCEWSTEGHGGGAQAQMLLSVASASGEIKVWSVVQAPSCAASTVGALHHSKVSALAVHSPSTFAVSGCHDGLLFIWDSHTGRLQRVCTGHSSGILHVDISACGSLIVSACADGWVKVWSVASAECLASVAGPEDESAEWCAFTPDSKYVCVLFSGNEKNFKILQLQQVWSHGGGGGGWGWQRGFRLCIRLSWFLEYLHMSQKRNNPFQIK